MSEDDIATLRREHKEIKKTLGEIQKTTAFYQTRFGMADQILTAQYIAQNHRGGDVYWVVKGFVARWENLDVNPPHGVKITIWMWGNPNGKNTILSRVGWWTLYLFDTAKRIQRGVTEMATAGFFERQDVR
jgi:hypothetical protein